MAEELISLSIELITEEKEKSVRELDAKLKRLEAYKKNPIDFYNKFGLKQSEYTSSDLDKEIKDIQNSLITIIDGIKSTD